MFVKSLSQKTAISRHVERAVVRACAHPALLHPLRYNIDYPRLWVTFFALLGTIVVTWGAYLYQPVHAYAPQDAPFVAQWSSTNK